MNSLIIVGLLVVFCFGVLAYTESLKLSALILLAVLILLSADTGALLVQLGLWK